MKKWFNKWFAKKCKEAWANSRPEKESGFPANLLSTASGPGFNTNGLNFTVYRANGGYIIEHRTYDKKHDRNSSGLHIITDDKDLGEEIGKIVTFEALRS